MLVHMGGAAAKPYKADFSLKGPVFVIILQSIYITNALEDTASYLIKLNCECSRTGDFKWLPNCKRALAKL